MLKVSRTLSGFARRGASGLQYAMMVGLIAVVILAGISATGSSLSSLYGLVSNRLQNGSAGAASSPPAPPTPADTTPDAFSFVDQTGVEPATLISASPVTVTGFDGPLTAICGSGCTDIARNGSWAGSTSLSGFQPGDSIAIRLNSAGYGGVATASVNLGATTSASWSVTTRGQDTTPNAFSFTDQNGVTANTTISSNAVTLAGFDGPLTANCVGGCTDIARNGSWAGSSSLGGFMPGDTIAIRQISSSSGATATTAGVAVGSTSASIWTVTTATGIVTEYTTAGSFTYVTPVSGTYKLIAIGGGGAGGSAYWGGGQGGQSGYGAVSNVSLSAGVSLSITVGAGGIAVFTSGDGRGANGATSSVNNGASVLVTAGGGQGGVNGGSTGNTTSETTENTGGGGSAGGRGGGYSVSGARGRGGSTNGGAAATTYTPGAAGTYYNTFDSTIAHGTGGTATTNYGAESDSGGGGGGGFDNAVKLTVDGSYGGVGARGYGAGGNGGGSDGAGMDGANGYVRIVRP